MDDDRAGQELKRHNWVHLAQLTFSHLTVEVVHQVGQSSRPGLATARRRAVGAGVAPRFILGDVTRLRELDVGDGYPLLLDFGCFHTLPEDQRPAYVTSVSRAAAPDATLLLYGFRQPPKAAPMHAGVTPEEIQRRFVPAGWHVVHADRTWVETMAAPRADIRFELWCYQLRHASSCPVALQ
jgi:hypothetical protein